VTVILEKQGVKRLDAWSAEQLASMAVIFEPLSPEERRILHDLLGKALTVGGDLPMATGTSSGGGRH